MKTILDIKLKPIRTPNFILVDCVEGGRFRLNEFAAETLSDLCDDFRAEIFQKAGKNDPSLNGQQP